MNDIDEEWKDAHEVTIPFSSYEYMLDCMIRLDILGDFLLYNKEVSKEDILLILDLYRKSKVIETQGISVK